MPLLELLLGAACYTVYLSLALGTCLLSLGVALGASLCWLYRLTTEGPVVALLRHLAAPLSAAPGELKVRGERQGPRVPVAALPDAPRRWLLLQSLALAGEGGVAARGRDRGRGTGRAGSSVGARRPGGP